MRADLAIQTIDEVSLLVQNQEDKLAGENKCKFIACEMTGVSNNLQIDIIWTVRALGYLIQAKLICLSVRWVGGISIT